MSIAGTPKHKTAQPFIRSEQGPRGTAYNYTLGQGPLYGVAVVVLASTTTTTTTTTNELFFNTMIVLSKNHWKRSKIM